MGIGLFNFMENKNKYCICNTCAFGGLFCMSKARVGERITNKEDIVISCSNYVKAKGSDLNARDKNSI